MQNLNFSEINKIGGGYLRLEDVDVFEIDSNSFMGGILHISLNPPSQKYKNFPKLFSLLD